MHKPTLTSAKPPDSERTPAPTVDTNAAPNNTWRPELSVRSTVMPDLNRYPLTVLAVLVAISAAQRGRAMAVSIVGISPSLTRELIERCQILFGTTSVEVLFARRKLDHPAELKLIVTPSPAGMVDTAARLAFLGPNVPRPALLAFSEPPVGADIFCPWLTLNCDDDETGTLRRWLAVCNPEFTDDYAATEVDAVQLDTLSTIESIVNPIVDESANDLFRAVLQGSATLFSASPLRPATEDMPLAAYVLTRELLSSPMATMADQSPSRLLRMMVDRANLLLEARRSAQASQTRLKVHQPSQKLSRSDFVDLGKPDSLLVTEIISYLRSLPDGEPNREKLCQMGIHNSQKIQPSLIGDEQALQRQLVTWSYKQVRTTLGQAVEAKWLTSERETKNGPVIYRLPESSRSLGNPWLALPTETVMAARISETREAGDGLP